MILRDNTLILLKSISGCYLELMIKDILKEMRGFRKESVVMAFEIN